MFLPTSIENTSTFSTSSLSWPPTALVFGHDVTTAGERGQEMVQARVGTSWQSELTELQDALGDAGVQGLGAGGELLLAGEPPGGSRFVQ